MLPEHCSIVTDSTADPVFLMRFLQTLESPGDAHSRQHTDELARGHRFVNLSDLRVRALQRRHAPLKTVLFVCVCM